MTGNLQADGVQSRQTLFVRYCLNYLNFVRMARVEFRIAMTDTPTSAKTAAPICARPTAPSTSTIALTPSAKTIFSRAMPMVFLAMCIASPSFEGLSSRMTRSAAAIAASEPRPPMATPTSDCASTGASFMPSPTKTSVLPFASLARYACMNCTLSAGRHLACTSSSCKVSPTASAADSLSPVSIATVETPACRNACTACAASGLIVSAIRI